MVRCSFFLAFLAFSDCEVAGEKGGEGGKLSYKGGVSAQKGLFVHGGWPGTGTPLRNDWLQESAH